MIATQKSSHLVSTGCTVFINFEITKTSIRTAFLLYFSAQPMVTMYYVTTWFLSIFLLAFIFICFLINNTDALSAYDATVLADLPVAYWPLDPSLPYDYSGHHLNGVFNNSASATTMPNSDTASVFNGINQYFTIGDNDYLEIVRTGILTIAAWFRPDTLQFNNYEGTGYVWWMGKGASNQQSWAARMYNHNNTENRTNRISGYAFNLTGGLGAGSYFEDNVTVGQWIFYTLTINTVNVSTNYLSGYTKIFKNGIERDKDALSGYSVVPMNGIAPMRIGTRQLDSFFKGAIGKVAVFDYELNSSQLQTHFNCMITSTNCVIVQVLSVTSGHAEQTYEISLIGFWIICTLSTRMFSY